VPQRSYIFLPTPTADPIELGDDAIGHRISGGLPRTDYGVMLLDGYKAPARLPVNTGNVSNAITWRVDRDHGSVAAAIAFMRDHPSQFPLIFGLAQGLLQDVGDDGSVRFLQNAAITRVHCQSWDGSNTVFEYTAEGGAWTGTDNGV
jgi:hypothetical protein